MSFKGHENDKVLCFISKVEHFDNSKWQFEGKGKITWHFLSFPRKSSHLNKDLSMQDMFLFCLLLKKMSLEFFSLANDKNENLYDNKW